MQVNGSDKKQLRRELKLRRSKMPPQLRAELSRGITDILTSSDVYRRCDTLLCFASTDIEVDTSGIISAALSDGKRLALPVCLSYGQMEFRRITSPEQLVQGAYGIYEPPENCAEVSRYDTENALCIVPGLAYDKKGFRLGFGGGFYDRWLPDFRGVSCGVCYEEFVLPDLSGDIFDVPADMLATEKKLYIFNDRI